MSQVAVLRTTITEGADMSNLTNHAAKILRCIDDGVITTDMQGKITYMNPVAEKLTGVSGEDAVGDSFTELACLKRDDDGKMVSGTQRNEQTSDHVAVLHARDGAEYSVAYSMTALNNSDGGLDGYVVVMHDLSKCRCLRAFLP